MANVKNAPLIIILLLLLPPMQMVAKMNNVVSARGPIYAPPNVQRLTDRFTPASHINHSYNVLYGAQNVQMKNNGSTVDLILDKSSGCGLASKERYYYGFFNAAIKLPAGFTSGVVVAFYMSNEGMYPRNHDEIDIELLGYDKRRDWVLQTNLYVNGSGAHTAAVGGGGREEKFYLWFDPTDSFHHYSLLWNAHHILFLVDNIPVREVINKRHDAAINYNVYPAKPMSVYLTIWDGSQWATHGGKYPVNYQYAPFVASMGRAELEACAAPPPSSSSCMEGEGFGKLSEEQKGGLDWARGKHMFYSYCHDTTRYKVLPPECSPSSSSPS
ncbi:hypothetical protein DM860_006932 [Cuscuta australis]|uniref:Xyloglucan endotransglucosylase/hydrolase n=1 Tax=Cuscuta australis TaxID=267555 RepID=A0A328E6S3_9ASTE|nr:hypothetical protein DM860_006932 [Cuscuta australis]